MHALISILTGVVGLGDWVGMTNRTLVQRIARKDGVLLKPDRCLACHLFAPHVPPLFVRLPAGRADGSPRSLGTAAVPAVHTAPSCPAGARILCEPELSLPHSSSCGKLVVGASRVLAEVLNIDLIRCGPYGIPRF